MKEILQPIRSFAKQILSPYTNPGVIRAPRIETSWARLSLKMKSTPTAALAVIAFLYAATAQQPPQPTDNPAQGLPGLKTPTYVGCFKSSGSLVDMGQYTFQAMGWCQPLCVRQAKSILAFTGGTNCLCGDSLPSSGDKIDDSNCQTGCLGYPKDKCTCRIASDVYGSHRPAASSTFRQDLVLTLLSRRW